jgi:hypothetical protein
MSEESDNEAIAALDAFYDGLNSGSDRVAMRCALNEAEAIAALRPIRITDKMAEAARSFIRKAYPDSGWISHETIRGAIMAAFSASERPDVRESFDAKHRGQPASSSLADDARKIAQALEPFAKSPDVSWQVHQARHLWPIAESLPGKIEALERERDDLKDAAASHAQYHDEALIKIVTVTKERDKWEALAIERRHEIDRVAEHALCVESQLAERNAEVARLRKALKEILEYPHETDDVPRSHKGHYLLTCVQHIARAALAALVTEKEPTDGE